MAKRRAMRETLAEEAEESRMLERERAEDAAEDLAEPDPAPPSPCGWAFFDAPCNITGEHGHCAECAAPIPTDRAWCVDHAALQDQGG